MSPGYNFSHEFNGTLPYCSPEIFKGEPYNQKTDVWALGCILYEMIVGKRAFDFQSEEALKARILSYQIPQLPQSSDSYRTIKELGMVYALCMQRCQEDRPNVTDILGLDFVHI